MNAVIEQSPPFARIIECSEAEHFAKDVPRL